MIFESVKEDSDDEDEVAIKQIEILWDEAWNRHDSEALASLLSEDADFVTVAGVWTKDRTEFRRLMERLQQTQFKDSTYWCIILAHCREAASDGLRMRRPCL